MKDLLDLLDLLGLLVREASLEPLDLWDLQDDLDLRGLLDLLERRVFLARKVPSARLDGTGFRARWVCQAPLGLRGSQEKMETRVKLESRVRKAPKERRESTVLLVLQGRWVLLVSLVLLGRTERPAPGGSRDILEPKVMKVPEVSPELQDPSGFRVCPGRQARRERLETSDLWVPPAPQDLVAPLDPTVLMVPKVLLVVWEILVLWVRRESLERPVHPASAESQGRRGPEVNVERRERPVSPGQLGLQEEEADQETTGPKETLVLWVSLVILGPQVKLDPEARMEPRAREERTASRESLALLVPPERTAHLDLWERGGPPDREDLRAVRERREQRVTQEQSDLQERLAPSDLRDLQENQAQKA